MHRDSIVRQLWIAESGSGPDFAAFGRTCQHVSDIDLAARLSAARLSAARRGYVHTAAGRRTIGSD